MDSDLKVNTNEYLPLRDVIFSTLRQAILKGGLAPRERLVGIQLAERLRMSETPTHEIIRKLGLEGLVLMIPRKGAEVAKISEKSLRNVPEVHHSLEELATELACQRMGESGVKQLEEAQLAFREAVNKGDATAIAESGETYHDIAYYGTGNARLIQILSNLREQIYRYRLEYIKDTGKRQMLLVRHKEILKATKGRHVAETKEAMREHVDSQEITVSRNIKEKE